tara:strand:+ start:39378 stop:39545 length:168 start_codon:yes stop_codon:yes gene_type:complete
MDFNPQWILTNTLAMFDVLVLGVTLLFVIKIAKAHAKSNITNAPNQKYFILIIWS